MPFEWKKRKVEKPTGNIFAVSGGGNAEDTDGATGSDELQRKQNPVISKDDFSKKRAEGVKLAEEGKFKEAAIVWKRILKNPHGDISIRSLAEVWEMIAQVYAELGNYLEACNAGDECVALEPNWLQGLLTRGRARFEFGEIVTAGEDFKKIVALCQNRVQVCQEGVALVKKSEVSPNENSPPNTDEAQAGEPKSSTPQADESKGTSSKDAPTKDASEKEKPAKESKKKSYDDDDFSKLPEGDKEILKEARQELWRVHDLQKKFGKDKVAVVNDRIVQMPFWETALKVTYGPDGRPEEESFAHILRSAAEDAVGLSEDSPQPDEEAAPSASSAPACGKTNCNIPSCGAGAASGQAKCGVDAIRLMRAAHADAKKRAAADAERKAACEFSASASSDNVKKDDP